MVLNRKWVQLGAAVLCCAAAAFSQNLTGKWVGQASLYDNGLEFVLAVNQAADGALTGYIQGGRFNDTITGGKVEGDKVTLEAERPGRGGTPQKITYNAVLEGGKLKLTMPALGGRGPGRGPAAGGPPPPPRPPQVFELTRVSTAKPEPLPARAPLVKLEMPAPVKGNGLATTPPMGWNSCNKFQAQVTDAMVRETADATVKPGRTSAG